MKLKDLKVKNSLKRIRNIKLHMSGVNHVITWVFYLSELKNILLSIGQMQEKWLTILIHQEMCKIYHPIKTFIIQTTMPTNQMFTLSAKVEVKNAVNFLMIA